MQLAERIEIKSTNEQEHALSEISEKYSKSTTIHLWGGSRP